MTSKFHSDHMVTASFVYEGFFYPDGVFNIPDEHAEDYGGAVGCTSALHELVTIDLCAALEAINAKMVDTLEFPGVFDYEVSEQAGAAFRSTNDQDVLRLVIVKLLLKFFHQYDTLTLMPACNHHVTAQQIFELCYAAWDARIPALDAEEIATLGTADMTPQDPPAPQQVQLCEPDDDGPAVQDFTEWCSNPFNAIALLGGEALKDQAIEIVADCAAEWENIDEEFLDDVLQQISSEMQLVFNCRRDENDVVDGFRVAWGRA